MKTAKVIVLPYDTAWKTAFEEIKKEKSEKTDDKNETVNFIHRIQCP